MTRTRTIWIALTLTLLTVAAACSSTSDATPVTAKAAPAADGTVEVTAVDFSYVGLPDTVAAGTRLVMTNDSATELHELVAIRVPDDETMSVGDLVKLPMNELGQYLAEPTAVLIAPPTAGSIPVVGDGVLAEPGRYAIICLIPTGADPDEYLKAAAESGGGPPEVDGGPPHIANGMYAEITVTG